MKKTQNYHLRSGTTHPLKGKVGRNDLKMYTWDLIDDCLMDKCAAYNICDFIKNYRMVKDDGTPKKCRIMYWYLKGATDVLFSEIDHMDQYTVWRIGMRLLPMYRSLCKLQIAEAGTFYTTYQTSRGDVTVHPIHKEIALLQERIDRIEQRIYGKDGPVKLGRDKSKLPIPFERPIFIPGKKKVDKKTT